MISYEYPVAMPSQDFDLYPPHQEQYSEQIPSNQIYVPTATYLDSTFTTYESQSQIAAFSNVPQHHEYQYGFDQAQALKSGYSQHYSPTGSPNSGSHSFDMQPPHLSTSSESGASVSSSAMGSPSLNSQFTDSWGLGLAAPGMTLKDDMVVSSGFEYDSIVAAENPRGCVDPHLIQPSYSPLPFTASPYPEIRTTPSPHFPFVEQPPSPAPSNTSVRSQTHMGSRRFKQSGSQSPYLHVNGFQPYPNYPVSRRLSVSSVHSRNSSSSRRSGSYELDDETREKGLCPIPDCGRVFKDLKAHMLTHQNERPEKCPIVTCEYHMKGFARKYDKNRHTLTHYKGTMVCGFCPGSGSAAEKSFNRADVFKRHLTSVHGVEQTAPNSRKKSPTGKKAYANSSTPTTAGTCSTCSVTFANAQDFYEHLDDCVLRVVQQADPSEAINQKLLTAIGDDAEVKETLESHGLPTNVEYTAPSYEEDEEDEDDEVDVDDVEDGTYGARSNPRSGRGAMKLKRNASA